MAGRRDSYGKRSHSQSDYSENGVNKRRNTKNDKDPFSIGPDDTVYRYLCPAKKIGSIIGKGGEIVKQLRLDTKSKIRIGETVSDCDERVVTIYSSSEETNEFDGTEDRVCPAQDALFRVHDKIVSDDTIEKDSEEASQIIVKLLVPSDQIGCIIGKGGQIVQDIRSETGAQIRILKDKHLPACALTSDELVQISGDAVASKDALMQVTSRLRANFFEKEGPTSAFVPVLSYLPMSADSDTLKYESRDTRRHVREHPYSAGYGGTSDLPHADGFGSYGTLQSSSSVGYGAYEGYSPAYPKEGYSHGRSSGPGSSRQNSASRRKSYGY